MVNGRVDDKSSTVDVFALVVLADDIAIVVDFDQVRSLHVVEQHAIAVNQKVIRLIRHAHTDVGINQIRHAKMRNQAVQSREFAAGLPFAVAYQIF